MESPELTKVEGEGPSLTSAEAWLTRPKGMPSGNLWGGGRLSMGQFADVGLLWKPY